MRSRHWVGCFRASVTGGACSRALRIVLLMTSLGTDEGAVLVEEIRAQRRLPASSPRLDGEALSSWIVRQADAHGMSVQSLSFWLHGRGRQLFGDDVDRGAWGESIAALARATRQPTEDLRQGTLMSYQGRLWGHCPPNGPVRWVLPVGRLGAQRIGFGMQYCPSCLATDELIHMRLQWRLAFIVCCPTHRCLLVDACVGCGAPVAAHRWRTGFLRRVGTSGLFRCDVCGLDRRTCSAYRPVDHDLVASQLVMSSAMSDGFAQVGENPIYALAFFSGAAALWSALDDQRNASILGDVMGSSAARDAAEDRARYGGIERHRVDRRAALLRGFGRVLTEGLTSFVARFERAGMASHRLLRYTSASRTVAPYWLSSVVRERLDRTFYVPTEAEVRAAAQWLQRELPSGRASAAKVCRLLGMRTRSSSRIRRILSLLSAKDA